MKVEAVLLAAFVLFLSPAVPNLDRNTDRNHTSTHYKAIIPFWRLSIANQGKSNIDKNTCEPSNLRSFLLTKLRRLFSHLRPSPNICMYVCMYVCSYVYGIWMCFVCVCMYVHVYMYMYVCMYVHVCMYVCIYICMYVCMYTYVCMYVHVCIYIYIYMYMECGCTLYVHVCMTILYYFSILLNLMLFFLSYSQ